ncbi:26S proteasome regulatory subunit 10B isoform X4 [Bos javanicus]|uniref:26S proteasome regulatory subunit 10B isoform X4 n=1 Tax=Bos javanicus TaxID=9906 RepID=UPI002AA5EDBC|nr:26S proteasome regulatory subunit 10B isoform X4 [Bos javanicus]
MDRDMLWVVVDRYLPREVDPLVYNMSHEDPGNVSYSEIGGLSEQIRELREVIELPLTNPELFQRVGIIPPKGCLLYGPPGTGKTLLARAVASQLDCNFLKVVSSSIVDKYIGESARLIREMFNYARDHQPCIIFMDEIDAIGGRRFSEGTSADREIQRTLMELLNQMDGFDTLHRVKMIMATNRPDTLDPALLRPGRLDRKIHIDLPNEQARLDILKIHAGPITKHGEIDYEAIVKLSDGFNGADLRNVCTEADGRRQWQPTPVLLPGKSHGQRNLVGCSPRGHKESDTTELLPFYFSLSCIGEGNGNPLQCSCLENPRDRGAWWAAVFGVAQSDTTDST